MMNAARPLSDDQRHRAYMILGNLPLLEDVANDTVKRLVQAAQLSVLPPGTRLLRQGAGLSESVFVLRGVVRVVYSEQAHEYTPKILVAPCQLGHLEMLTGRSAALASIDVVEEAWIASVSWQVLRELLMSDHALALGMLEDLAMDFALAADAARQAAFGGLPARIANVLLSYTDAHEAAGERGPVPIPVNHHQLARYVASPRRSVIRVMQQLHAQEFVRDHLGRIVVNDARRLREHFCSTSLGLTHRFQSPSLRRPK